MISGLVIIVGNGLDRLQNLHGTVFALIRTNVMGISKPDVFTLSEEKNIFSSKQQNVELVTQLNKTASYRIHITINDMWWLPQSVASRNQQEVVTTRFYCILFL